MVSWEEITNGLDHGGYVAWETAVDAANGDQARDHVPVFLELVPPTGMTLVQAIDGTLALTEIKLSRHERNILATDRERAGSDPTIKVRTVAFWPRARLSTLPNFWKILRVGSPLALPPDQGGPGVDLCAIPGDLAATVPVAAVIDDGIGFLNVRFRKDRDHTRIRGLWVQAPERGAVSGDVLCGLALDSDKINALLAAGGEEPMIYRHVNRSILPSTEGALTDRHAAHGTHVLDLAAGAAPWAGDTTQHCPDLRCPASPRRDPRDLRSADGILPAARPALDSCRGAAAVPPYGCAADGGEHKPWVPWVVRAMHRRFLPNG